MTMLFQYFKLRKYCTQKRVEFVVVINRISFKLIYFVTHTNYTNEYTHRQLRKLQQTHTYTCLQTALYAHIHICTFFQISNKVMWKLDQRELEHKDMLSKKREHFIHNSPPYTCTVRGKGLTKDVTKTQIILGKSLCLTNNNTHTYVHIDNKCVILFFMLLSGKPSCCIPCGSSQLCYLRVFWGR